ncbi:MAG TPA: DUF58 domain-containing protein [Rhodanobacteraceae bacterium]|nr:DUF58 domain-containing protein [Rhodanobacteraceae bacterium]
MSAAARLRAATIALTRRAELRLPALTRQCRAEPLPIVLHRRRIYIVPTRFGLLFAVMLLVMLLGALNYNNNAALLLTCLLGAAAVNSMYSAFRALNGLHLEAVAAGSVQAGRVLPVTLSFSAAGRPRRALTVSADAAAAAFAVGAGTVDTVTLALPTVHRGWMPLPPIRLHSTWPFGLFRAWSWLRPQARLLVYARAESAALMPPAADPTGTSAMPLGDDSDDGAGLREYRPGDAPRRIAWKVSAHHDDLRVRQPERASDDAEWRLDWHALRGIDHERRIARLAHWVNEAQAARARWSLILPDVTLGPDRGERHWHACQSALALLP